jgi:DNA-directed RNA polymerase subunit RPC12/RpoP
VQVDLRTSDKLFVEIKASSAEGLAEGAQRVRRAIADVLQAHGVAPKTPPQPPEAVEEPVFVLPSAPSGPPPSWGVAPPAPPPQAPALADEALAEQSCGLCMADVTANVRMEPCGHYACVSCVANLRRRALFVSTAGVPCPYCRTIIVRYDAPPGVDVGLQARAGACCPFLAVVD